MNTISPTLRRSIDALKEVARRRVATPILYQLFLLTSDGFAVCNRCCRARFRDILRDQKTYRRSVDDVVACEVDYDSEIYCELCSIPIVESVEAIAATE